VGERSKELKELGTLRKVNIDFRGESAKG